MNPPSHHLHPKVDLVFDPVCSQNLESQLGIWCETHIFKHRLADPLNETKKPRHLQCRNRLTESGHLDMMYRVRLTLEGSWVIGLDSGLTRGICPVSHTLGTA